MDLHSKVRVGMYELRSKINSASLRSFRKDEVEAGEQSQTSACIRSEDLVFAAHAPVASISRLRG